MEAEAKTPQPESGARVTAGQPVTFGGVAAFGQGSWRRLFIAQAVVAGAGVAAVLILLFNGWLPAVESAIHNLPENAYVLHGELAWPKQEAVQLTDSRWLTVVVAPGNTHGFGKSADFQIELHGREARLYSMLGYVEMPYGKELSVQLSRPDAVPWWGARRPFFIAAAIVSTFLGLWLTWMLLAVLYAPVAKLLAFWTNRNTAWGQSVRLSAAALLTPAVVFGVAIALYGLGWLPLEGLIGACVLHFIMGWIYVAGASIRLAKKRDSEPATNPFDHASKGEGTASSKPAGNPFKGA